MGIRNSERTYHVFSRMQIEKLIQQYQPTMLLVEHDRSFAEKCGTKIIQMG